MFKGIPYRYHIVCVHLTKIYRFFDQLEENAKFSGTFGECRVMRMIVMMIIRLLVIMKDTKYPQIKDTI